jgi:type IV secretory pathway TrbL component
MNKKNQRIEVNLSVIAISAILVAALFVMGSSRFITDAMAQNFTDQTGAAAGGAANQTGAAAGGAANQTGAAAGGAANQTGAAAGGAAGGAANQTGAAAGGAAGGAANQSGMVMIPQAAMVSMMDDIETVRGSIDEGDTEAVDALDNVEMQLRTAAGLPPAATDTADEGDTDTADEDTDTADEETTTTTDEDEEG